jgi:hypothetical protein
MTRKTSGLLSNEVAITRELAEDGYDTVKVVRDNLTDITLVADNIPAMITAEADASAAAASAAAALVSENAAAADLALTNADVVLTHADVVLTNADVLATAADVISSAANAASASADAANLALDTQFLAHETTVPDMTVTVDAGKVFKENTFTSKSEQITSTITAPVTDPRIDRIAIDITTGNIVIIPGTENVSPVAPDYSNNHYPICQFQLEISTTSIIDSTIVDERALVQRSSFITEVIDIGDWNMDTTVSVSVAHGLADHTKIRSMSVTVRNDADSAVVDFGSATSAADTGNIEIVATSTDVVLTRAGSGTFDSSVYDSTSYNRGWIVIQYTD